MTLREVADRRRRVAQCERPVDDRGHVARFDQPPHVLEVLPTLLRDDRTEPLSGEQRQQRGPDTLPAEATGPTIASLTAHDREGALRSQRAPQLRQGTTPGGVDDRVPAARSVEE